MRWTYAHTEAARALAATFAAGAVLGALIAAVRR